jgi:replicative DNA helicase
VTQLNTLEAYMILGQELIRRVYAEDSPEELHAWLSAQVTRLSGGDESARLLWDDSFALYEQIMATRKEKSSLPQNERKSASWPWESWTKYLDPLDAGMLAVLSAADGTGKTLAAENVAEHWAKSGLNVVFVHFELNRSLMLDRRMVRQTGISRRDLKTGTLTPEQELTRRRADDSLRSWPGSITYLHTPRWTMEKAIGEVAKLVSEDLCDAFVIDYLEKAAPSNAQLKSMGSNVFSREADDVEIIKSAAEALERPALLLSQMNKSGKRTNFDQLDRTAIRGSGEKTEKANVVILLHKDTPESPIVQVRIDKNTMGPCGVFEQYMEGSRFLLVDLAADDASGNR